MNVKFFYIILVHILIKITGNLSTDLISNDDDDSDDNKEEQFFNKCYEDLGCIETDGRWYHPVYRPVNLAPLEPSIIRTEFLLIKNNQTKCRHSLLYKNVQSDIESLEMSGFIDKYRTIILIHDFTSNGYTGWIKNFATKMFMFYPKLNVVSVDWQRGAEAPFDQAISNARLVALEVAKLIKTLQQFKIFPHDIEIIGHGVGAHIAGYVGINFNKIYKITGLDPTGPRFDHMPDIVKLNPKTAKYVEVLHTDAFNSRSQGSREPMGHSDFFINDAYLQPGCKQNVSELVKIDRNSLNVGQILAGCSHKRAFRYYLEALHNQKCTFLGIRCKNHEEFIKGNCINCGNKNSSGCRSFGLNFYNNSQEKLSYYINTNEESPFCVFQYVISVELDDGKDHYGYFDFILIDEHNNLTNATLKDPETKYRNFFHNSTNKYLYYANPPRLFRIKEAKIQWNEQKKLYCIIYCKQTIHVKNVTIKPIGREKMVKSDLCPLNGKGEIENGEYTTFVTCS